MRHYLLAIAAFTLTSCQQDPDTGPAQRIALDDVQQQIEEPLPSPDTALAVWTVAASGKAINFGNAGEKPWLSLECRLSADMPPELAVIRHASGFPGQTALFAVMGNGYVSRLPAAAVLYQGADGDEWRWETSLPAADPAWNLFIGNGDMRATLPGKGAIAIPPNPIPGEFVTWCRAGGRPSITATPTPTPEPN